ncbi:GRB2-associated-binding protein 2 [Liparis tanakae]|uniref:GRB2-associated-binding protein 2 n=1 Tax=Liparis tanakae TaxID=230148 RepID=A0A4Z2HSE2_9TELE|nr:GRB2-associated-binding protein 2 [Liparis tanakae]
MVTGDTGSNGSSNSAVIANRANDSNAPSLKSSQREEMLAAHPAQTAAYEPQQMAGAAEAWKKRWFILRSGRMSGDPDVLEYYKNDHSKKPIRVIDLHCCEQVDAGLTFKRKEFQDSFVFDIKTSDRTFYLVAETEEEMNKWVRSICQLCGFNQSDDNHVGCTAFSRNEVRGLQMSCWFITNSVTHRPRQALSLKSIQQSKDAIFPDSVEHPDPSLCSVYQTHLWCS